MRYIKRLLSHVCLEVLNTSSSQPINARLTNHKSQITNPKPQLHTSLTSKPAIMQLPILLSIVSLAAAAPLHNSRLPRGTTITTPGFEVSGPGVGDPNNNKLVYRENHSEDIVRNIGARNPIKTSTTPGFEVSQPGDGEGKIAARLSKVTTPGFEVSGPGVGEDGEVKIATRDDDEEGTLPNLPGSMPAHKVDRRQSDQELQALTNVEKNIFDMSMAGGVPGKK